MPTPSVDDDRDPALPMPVLRPVARLKCDFTEKFGLPRQPDAASEVRATVVFLPEFDRAEMIRELMGFSHLWLIGQFHRTPWTGASTVRPPRLGGNRRVGVWASRAPNRPNSLSLTLVRLLGCAASPLRLEVAGNDMVDGTPIFDLKPYLPWCESVPDAISGWATAPTPLLPVEAISFASEAVRQALEQTGEARATILNMLRSDPRPAYLAGREREKNDDEPAKNVSAFRLHGATIAGWNVRWRRHGDKVEVVEVVKTGVD